MGDDYCLANYKQLAELLGEARERVGPAQGRHHRHDRGGPAAAHGRRHVAGQPPTSSTATRRSPAGSPWPRASTEAEARQARRRGQGGRVDRRRAARQRDRSAPRCSSRRVYQFARRQRRRDAPHPRRRGHPVRPRQPGRARPRRRLVHARDRTRRSGRWPACRGSTRSTSATTTTATSTPTPRPRRRNMNRVMYREWFPQIVYNHHQSGPPGTVLFCPPFRDPFNYNIDPLVINGIDAVGAAMMQRFLAEGKPGATVRSGARYSTWLNGGLRDHLLLPQHDRPVHRDDRQPDADADPVRRRQCSCPAGDYLAPIAAAEVALPPVGRLLGDGQQGGPRLRLAAPRAAALQHLADGQERHRPRQPRQLDGHAEGRRGGRSGRGRRRAARPGPAARREFAGVQRSSATRPSATRAATSSRPTSPTSSPRPSSSTCCSAPASRSTGRRPTFEVGGKKYPAGSYVVKSAQAFRAARPRHVRAAGPPQRLRLPRRPADAALRHGRLDARVPDGREVRPHPRRLRRPVRGGQGRRSPPPPARVPDADGRGRASSSTPGMNDSFRAVNRLLTAGEEVRRLQRAVRRRTARPTRPGRSSSPRKPTTLPLAGEDRRRARHAVHRAARPPRRRRRSALKPVRVGLWDRYGGSMPSGWTRWLLEQFEFPFQVVYPPELDKGGPAREVRRARSSWTGRSAARRGRARGGGRRRRPAAATEGAAGGEDERSPPSTAAAAAASPRTTTGAALQEVPRSRRHGPDHRQLDEPRPAPRPAGGEPPGRRRTRTARSGRCGATSSTSRRRCCGRGWTRRTRWRGAWATRWT